MLVDFRERGRREKERERDVVCERRNPQPRRVPRPGMESETFQCAGPRPANRAALARVHLVSSKGLFLDNEVNATRCHIPSFWSLTTQ